MARSLKLTVLALSLFGATIFCSSARAQDYGEGGPTDPYAAVDDDSFHAKNIYDTLHFENENGRPEDENRLQIINPPKAELGANPWSSEPPPSMGEIQRRALTPSSAGKSTHIADER